MTDRIPPDSSLSRPRFLVLAAAIVVLAFVLREQFILITQVQVPIRGDIRQYVAYAFNLVNDGTFSAVEPGSGSIVPDAFRGPGYPSFIAAIMLAARQPGAWYELALHAQAALGAGSVLLVVALGRHWLSRASSLGAGMLLAIWPHHIAASGALLSELLFGFVLLLGAWLAVEAARKDRISLGLAAGAAFAYAYLINPVIALFPPLVALMLWRRNRPIALCLLLIPALVAAGWAARNATVPKQAGPGRVTINLVQGSWPDYHIAHAFRLRDPAAAQVLQAIDDESALMAASPAKGLATVGQRIGQSPGAYLRWYVLEKPYLLWDWDIRLGHGDVYFLEVERSPLDTNPVLRFTKELLHRLNLAIFLLSATAALTIGFRFRRFGGGNFPAAVVASFCIYVTLVHIVFQAEPRYSIAYRPFQMLMLVTALSVIASWTQARLVRKPDGSELQ